MWQESVEQVRTLKTNAKISIYDVVRCLIYYMTQRKYHVLSVLLEFVFACREAASKNDDVAHKGVGKRFEDSFAVFLV